MKETYFAGLLDYIAALWLKNNRNMINYQHKFLRMHRDILCRTDFVVLFSKGVVDVMEKLIICVNHSLDICILKKVLNWFQS